MPVSPYIRPYSDSGQQGLIDSLTAETIFLGGWDIIYLPRKDAVEEDSIFGQSQQLKFDSSFNVAVLIENTDGFEGEGEFYSKFGLEIKDRMRITMSRKTWETIEYQDTYESAYQKDQRGFDTFRMEFNSFGSTSDNIVLEPESDGIIHTLALETGSQSSLRSRPFEGDLVYFPFNKKVFQITFVEHEAPFYPGGIIPQYQMVCDLLEYSNEIFNTGIREIDSIEDNHAQGRAECYVSTQEGYGTFNRGEVIYKTSDFGLDDHTSTSPSARVLHHDEWTGKLTVVPMRGGFTANDIIVGGIENTVANLATEGLTTDQIVAEDNGDNLVLDIQLEALSPLKLEAEEGNIIDENGVDRFSITIITTGSFRRLTFVPEGSFAGITDTLILTPDEELDTPADVLAQNEEFEEVASQGEEIGGTQEESFIDFSEIDPFSDGNF